MYDPPNQTSSALLFWRSPEEWAQVLYDWVRISPSSESPVCCADTDNGCLSIYKVNSTGHLNTIMTFFEIVEPPVPSPLEGLPLPILRKAVAVLAKSARAQIIAVADGEGVRFLAGAAGR